tara:strand:- start:3322 stop:3588 length:267 start_codon:yes stop_codon:yes gene_type:complete
MIEIVVIEKMNLPLCALSRLPMPPFIIPIAIPSSLTAALESPRLLVNTFKHTLRGGISSEPSLLMLLYRCSGTVKCERNIEGNEGISR